MWSLYLVGLFFLLLAAFVLGGAPKSPQGSIATLVAMLIGFEAAIASLTALYWLAWGQRDGGFYLYLLVLAAAGAAVLSLMLFVYWRKAVRRHL